MYLESMFEYTYFRGKLGLKNHDLISRQGAPTSRGPRAKGPTRQGSHTPRDSLTLIDLHSKILPTPRYPAIKVALYQDDPHTMVFHPVPPLPYCKRLGSKGPLHARVASRHSYPHTEESSRPSAPSKVASCQIPPSPHKEVATHQGAPALRLPHAKMPPTLRCHAHCDARTPRCPQAMQPPVPRSFTWQGGLTKR